MINISGVAGGYVVSDRKKRFAAKILSTEDQAFRMAYAMSILHDGELTMDRHIQSKFGEWAAEQFNLKIKDLGA